MFSFTVPKIPSRYIFDDKGNRYTMLVLCICSYSPAVCYHGAGESYKGASKLVSQNLSQRPLHLYQHASPCYLSSTCHALHRHEPTNWTKSRKSDWISRGCQYLQLPQVLCFPHH